MKTMPTNTMSPDQALKGIEMLFDAMKQNHKVTEEEKTKRKSIEALKEVELEKIKTQKEVLKYYLKKTFKERKENFDRMFDALDKGIENNNLEMIQYSLGAIVEVAKESPLKQLEQLRNDFRNPDVKEIEI